ncbi:MAG: lipid-A-disaccharide synthase [Pirellulales bacterium]
MKIFFSVGEPSGDLHGANLIRELRQRCPGLQAVGYGGPKMAAAGCQLHTDLTQLAIMALLRALTNLHRFLALLWRADRYFRQERPDAVVLIDFPGFNWWIARRAKARGIPVIYYGTPQLWAWAPWRVRKMRKYVDHVICKLPFEVPWYAERQCRAVFVGHPYFDQLSQQPLDAAFLAEQRQHPEPLVLLLPGSRTQEVTGLLPMLLKTAAHVQANHPGTRVAVANYSQRHRELSRAILESLPAAERPHVEFHVDRTQELMELATCCVACSGSVSLELMYRARPTVIAYRTDPFTLWLQGLFRTCKYITLVNLLAVPDRSRQISTPVYDPDAANAEDVPMPEYLTSRDRSREMASWVCRWLTDPADRERRAEWLRELRDRYGHPGASRAAAEYILTALSAGAVPAQRAA